MIHPNIEAAREALQQYREEVCKLMDKLGITEQCEDSCCATYASTDYIADDGNRRTLTE